MDPDYIAFRELLRRADTDAVLAADLTRLMAEGAPLQVLLRLARPTALRLVGGSQINNPAANQTAGKIQ